jgi:outer membrane biosynthesis protein TonB
MGRLKATLLALCLAALAATALSACGGGDSADLLPGETAREINANLDLVETLVGEGDCVGASNAAAAVSEQVEALGGVDKELKEALAKGAARLNEVITECDEASEEETTSSAELENEEREEEDRAKEEEKAQKEAEKEQKKEQKKEEKDEKETPPTEPPGQEKKEEETETPPTESGDGGTPSGGVSPGTEVGGE